MTGTLKTIIISLILIGLFAGCAGTPEARTSSSSSPSITGENTEEVHELLFEKQYLRERGERFPTLPLANVFSDIRLEPITLDFVDIKEYAPDVIIDLKYATADNFTGEVIYDFTCALLRRGTAEKLKKANEEFLKQGYRLHVWDAFRPKSGQIKLWEVCPNTGFVANPYVGGSNHTRGTAVDVTLEDMEGNLLSMPTGFDSFTPLAGRDYSGVTDAAVRRNVELLERVMKDCGFDAYQNEWWHFSDTNEMPLYEGRLPKLALVRLNISAVGDCVLGEDDRYPKDKNFSSFVKKGDDYFFSNFAELFQKDSLTVANLEGVLTKSNNKQKKPPQGEREFWFKGNPSYGNILKVGGVDAVSIANNHALDFGTDGFEESVKILTDSGIATAGYGSFTIIEKDGVRVALLSYNTLGPLELGEDVEALKKTVKQDILKIKLYSHLVIVSFHWGEEYESKPNETQSELAHFTIDSGAHIILGHHPHVLQPAEYYKGGVILYSLGNFVYGGSPQIKGAAESAAARFAVVFDSSKTVKNILLDIIPAVYSTGEKNANNYCPKRAEEPLFGEILKKILP